MISVLVEHRILVEIRYGEIRRVKGGRKERNFDEQYMPEYF